MANLPDKLFIFWFRSSGRYSKLCAILAERGFSVSIVQNAESLAHVTGKPFACLAILDPTSNFTAHELDQITAFLARGNSALAAISANEQDDSRLATNINDLTRRVYGVEFQEDCVVRPNPYKLYHPKEAMLEDFVANRGLSEVLKQHMEQKPSEDHLSRPVGGPVQFGPRIIYPQGSTLKILDGDDKKSHATIMLTSSRWALPGGQPVCTFHQDSNGSGGGGANAIVLGSSQLLSDNYLDKEDNRPLVECFLDFLCSSPGKPFPINISDARTIEICASNMTADFSKLTQEPIGCLRRLDPLPEPRMRLIDATLFGLDNCKLSLVIEAYRELDVAYEPLALMRPNIEWPGVTDRESAGNYLLKSRLSNE